MAFFDPQQMVINFMKGLGINEELIVGKLQHFVEVADAYKRDVTEINRRIDIMEQNIALICEKLEIAPQSEKTDIDKIRLVSDKANVA